MKKSISLMLAVLILTMLTLLNDNNFDITSLGIDLSEYGIEPKKDEASDGEKRKQQKKTIRPLLFSAVTMFG